MTLDQNCFSLKFLPERRLLVAQQTDSMILELPSGRELERAPPSVFGADRMAVSADGQRWAWPIRDGTIRVWNCQAREDEFRFRGQPAYLNGLLFTRDGRRLISVGHDSTIRVWGFNRATDARTLCRVRAVGGLAFSNDGEHIAIATSNAGSHGIETGRVRIHDVATGDELQRLDAVGDVAFSSDNRWLATNRSDGSATLWDTARWQPVRRFYSPGFHSMRLAISPDCRRLLCGTEKGVILAFDLAAEGPPTILEGHSNLVTSLAFTSDGARWASCDRMGKVILWDRDLRQIATWQMNQNLQRLVFSPDGRRLALAGGSQFVTIWDCATGTEMTRLHGHTAWVWGLAYMPDGALIVTSGADDTVRIWDAESGQELLSLPGVRYNPTHIAVSPDGLRIAAGDTALRLWEIDRP
jgi:WD40 repeat protein